MFLMKQEKNEYAVAAFHKRNLEMIRAVIQTVEDLDVPVIPQHVEVNDNLLLWKKLARLWLLFTVKFHTAFF
ncbi:hypothetical protein CQJ30_17425 [Caldibacillus thermoamylovorans]|jgi:fructose/tagatose bisphosphate aldolase|nr:hypothetical protein CQJ30_17425 [Caldibacillus thermoamylovorans]